MSLTREKIAQAKALVAASDFHVWLTFVRETAGGGDPVLPLLLHGGLTWHSALMVSRSGEAVAVLGNYDADPLVSSGDWDRVVPYVQGISEPLLAELERLVPAGEKPHIGVNFSPDNPKADGLSHGMFLTLEGMLKGSRFEGSLISAAGLVTQLRSRKTEAEIQRMGRAILETDRVFELVPTWARHGVSEAAIYREIQRYIDGKGFGYSWDKAGDPIVNSGPDSMIGHGIASEEIVFEPGHIFHIDLGLIVDEYSSDIQRCWYVAGIGESGLPDDVQKGFDAVVGAIQTGFETLNPGVEGWQVDAAARAFLVGQGYEEYLHAFGHQVGRVAHDGGALLGPKWERYGDTPTMRVEVGHVYTLELGVILPGRGYLGLEEMVVVREGGPEWLTKPQRTLPVLR